MFALISGFGRGKTSGLIAVGTLCLAASGAMAFPGGDGQPPEFEMYWDATGDAVGMQQYDFLSEVSDLGGGTYNFAGSTTGTAFDFSWDVNANADPFVDAAVSVTNNTGVTQTFTTFMVLNVSVSYAASMMNGSVAATLTNNDFFGGSATLAAAPGRQVFGGYVDTANIFADAPTRTLWEDPFSFDAVGGLAQANDNTFFAPEAGGAVTTNIGILLEFTLSAGDSATISGLFNVTPGPGGLAAFALFGLAGTRRRRS
jgi:MYXO-CTERM domain-containing protein